MSYAKTLMKGDEVNYYPLSITNVWGMSYQHMIFFQTKVGMFIAEIVAKESSLIHFVT